MITNEYPTVLSRSRDREALVQSHSTRISVKKARETIFAYIDEYEINTDVRFTGKTGRGLCEHFKNGKIDIMLPAEDTGKLTMGITLHELAHALAFLDRKGRQHDDGFVAVLDNLILSENEWQPE